MRSMSPNEGHFQSLLDPLLATLPDKSLPTAGSDQMDASAVSRSIPTTWLPHPDDCSDRYIPRRPSVSASMHQMEPSAYPVDDCIDYWSGRLRFGLALRGVVYILRFLSQHALNFVVGGMTGCCERCDWSDKFVVAHRIPCRDPCCALLLRHL